jgi:hypothetical protein
MKNGKIDSGSYVVVTTTHRGVFAGKLVERNNDEVVLDEARVCVYWSQATRGFVGLAVTGPQSGSRVSAAAPRMLVPNVTAILACTDEAKANWESGKWS